MHDNNIGCVILVTLEDKKTNGTFTERDVVGVLSEKFSPWLYRVPLRELMTKPVVTVEQT